MSKERAIEATVTGDDQKVGFRAMIMKQAIALNLAGFAVNVANHMVRFTLQGDKKRIANALATIQEGTKKSSGIRVRTSSKVFDPALEEFTILDWTSSSRNITNKYDLVFKLRAKDSKLSPKDAKAAWRQILQETLNPVDLRSCGLTTERGFILDGGTMRRGRVRVPPRSPSSGCRGE